MVMDDNHYLVEWLAYHYTFLPLRRLIVTIDPKSKTSPISILERYSQRNLIKITYLEDNDFFPNSTRTNPKYLSDPNRMHLARQSFFYLQCMKILKDEYTIKPSPTVMKKTKKPSHQVVVDHDSSRHPPRQEQQQHQQQQQPPIWVAFVDTDELIVLNERESNSTFQLPDIQPTVYEMLMSPKNHFTTESSQVCVPMSRLNIAVTETSDGEAQQQWMPFQFQQPSPQQQQQRMTFQQRHAHEQAQPSSSSSSSSSSLSLWKERNFKSIRYQYYVPKAMNGKALLDLSKVVGDRNDFKKPNVNCHRPLQNYCLQENVGISHKYTPLGVYHYPGTLEQYIFRADDARNWTRIPQKWYSLNYSKSEVLPTNAAKYWLQTFVNQVGLKLSEELLHGVGDVNPQ